MPSNYDLWQDNNAALYPSSAARHASAMRAYNVVSPAYGALGDDSNDDTAEIQAAIDAAIATGGIVFMPQGTYRISSPLDFSALAGTNKSVHLMGVGCGDNWAGGGASLAASTKIKNMGTGAAIKAYGSFHTTTNLPIVGLRLGGLEIVNTQNIGTNYTIDMDYCVARCQLHDIYIHGGGFTGNGINMSNDVHGQNSVERVTIRSFGTGSIGFRSGAFTTSNVDSGNVGASGNHVLMGVNVIDCDVGYDIANGGASGATSIHNGVHINCKAVRTSDLTSSVGFQVGTQCMCGVFQGCHSERFDIPWSVKGSGCTFDSCHAAGTSTQSGIGAGSGKAGWVIDGKRDTFSSIRTQRFEYGVKLNTNAVGNTVSWYPEAGAPPATRNLTDASSATISNWFRDLTGGFTTHSVSGGTAQTINAALNGPFNISCGDGTAFTMNAPLNPLPGQEIIIIVRNASGGAGPTITWNAAFTWESGTAPTNPANGKRRVHHLTWNGSSWLGVKGANDI